MSLIVLTIRFLFCHVFNNCNSILQRAGKFIGKNPCSNLSYHLEHLRQNEGYFLVKVKFLSLWQTALFLGRLLLFSYP